MSDMQPGGPPPEDESAEVVRYYNFWRTVARAAGQGSRDEPDWKDGRLYFRSDYSEKLEKWPEWDQLGDWGAWIIAPRSEGYVCVLSSVRHERSAERSEDIEVMFSRIADAGKYIILRIGDSVRSDLRLKTLFVKWDDRDLDSRIQAEPADQRTIEFLSKETPTLKDGFAEKYLTRYTFKDDPSSYGFALPSEQPRMEVLALSFEELTTALLDGMPESITSKLLG
jgi:hypothetical protein